MGDFDIGLERVMSVNDSFDEAPENQNFKCHLKLPDGDIKLLYQLSRGKRLPYQKKIKGLSGILSTTTNTNSLFLPRIRVHFQQEA